MHALRFDEASHQQRCVWEASMIQAYVIMTYTTIMSLICLRLLSWNFKPWQVENISCWVVVFFFSDVLKWQWKMGAWVLFCLFVCLFLTSHLDTWCTKRKGQSWEIPLVETANTSSTVTAKTTLSVTWCWKDFWFNLDLPGGMCRNLKVYFPSWHLHFSVTSHITDCH